MQLAFLKEEGINTQSSKTVQFIFCSTKSCISFKVWNVLEDLCKPMELRFKV